MRDFLCNRRAKERRHGHACGARTLRSRLAAVPIPGGGRHFVLQDSCDFKRARMGEAEDTQYWSMAGERWRGRVAVISAVARSLQISTTGSPRLSTLKDLYEARFRLYQRGVFRPKHQFFRCSSKSTFFNDYCPYVILESCHKYVQNCYTILYSTGARQTSGEDADVCKSWTQIRQMCKGSKKEFRYVL